MTVNSTEQRLNRHGTPLVLDGGARVWLITGLLGASATALFNTLCNQLPWRQPRLKLYGREHPVPRLTCWLGEAGVRYRYSGIDHHADGWPAALSPLLVALGECSGRHPNGALANLYRDGDDAMGWHRDNEPELGAAPWILSYNLGASRDFAFRRYGSGRQSHVLSLAHDSLLVMSPRVQQDFEHALPRRRRVVQPRLNLTFRDIVARR
ncbi:alpha-ketoglutarate-dependent dioxygenase AlkB family protein [Alloalcanivorax mobilis]|uniref:alpha-ketoglutarate-dependent dioxygenase AlkB family protein n=1 Tax=Alloalcanivorax mobilis TaxID=2019569 RepID=UPI000B5B473A|nr:alpha-ketoglutarate-dependent dioxygenase AlkB [Alloalcanivorax mobilis]ASK33911.1 alpha-ketoglutarate-dependent dioxygenase AlkB [Alcanivorax sp. N3-2A]|tara:strand:+ start:25259 stop:25885 length:627 start_codon:yes stop_codon:yes gene_type:complete